MTPETLKRWRALASDARLLVGASNDRLGFIDRAHVRAMADALDEAREEIDRLEKLLYEANADLARKAIDR